MPLFLHSLIHNRKNYMLKQLPNLAETSTHTPTLSQITTQHREIAKLVQKNQPEKKRSKSLWQRYRFVLLQQQRDFGL